MSRTDKDVPVWASAEYYYPVHHLRCINRPTSGSRRNEACNLPARVIREPTRWGRAAHCHWRPVESDEYRRRYWCTWGPRKDDRHFAWWGPDRAKVRDQMTKARQQYNGHREVEIVERVTQHRHGPVSGGYWD